MAVRCTVRESVLVVGVVVTMAVEVRWLSYSVFLTLVISQIIAEVPHKRFEYKYSFKPPYLAQKDGSVPFWEYGGSKFLLVFSEFHANTFQLLRRSLKLCIMCEECCISYTPLTIVLFLM